MAKLKRECAPPKASILRRLLYFFARRTYGRHLQKSYRIQHVNHEFLHELQSPYVIIANHVSNSDPFVYNILCPYPIAWIIGKSIERESKFPYLLKILRTIGRNKEMSDLDTVKKIRQWIDEGEVVGIFPEGQTSLTGVSNPRPNPIPNATAKLLRFLKVPVVSLRNEGGYFIQPRWAWKPRIAARGTGIILRYNLLFDAEQIQNAKLSEIQQKVQEALNYDPYHAPATPQLKQQNLAESLELVLHSCLDCLNSSEKVGTMYSANMELCCRACGAAWHISEDSHFLKHKELSYNLEEYRQEQSKRMQKVGAKIHVKRPFARVRMYEGSRMQESWRNGSLVLGQTGLQLKGKTSLNLNLAQIFAIHVFKHNILEFHENSILFVLEFPNKTDSAFLILDSLKILQECQARQERQER